MNITFHPLLDTLQTFISIACWSDAKTSGVSGELNEALLPSSPSLFSFPKEIHHQGSRENCVVGITLVSLKIMGFKEFKGGGY